MKELSLNILDITENSVKAGATLTQILLDENEETVTLKIVDNGCGMAPDFLKSVTDPFTTTRTTRKVGLGIPLLKMEAEQTGGSFWIESSVESDSHGTTVIAEFFKKHIDYTPLGDVASTVTTLIQGHPDTDFLFEHSYNGKTVTLDTREVREALGDVPLDSFEVLAWINESMREEYKELYN